MQKSSYFGVNDKLFGLSVASLSYASFGSTYIILVLLSISLIAVDM